LFSSSCGKELSFFSLLVLAVSYLDLFHSVERNSFESFVSGSDITDTGDAKSDGGFVQRVLSEEVHGVFLHLFERSSVVIVASVTFGLYYRFGLTCELLAPVRSFANRRLAVTFEAPSLFLTKLGVRFDFGLEASGCDSDRFNSDSGVVADFRLWWLAVKGQATKSIAKEDLSQHRNRLKVVLFDELVVWLFLSSE